MKAVNIPEMFGFDLSVDTTQKKHTQDYIPIKDIINGVIVTDDNRYLKVMEIIPINFFLMPLEERDILIESYASWHKIAPKNYQIKVLTKRADTSEYVKDIYECLREEQNEKTIKLAHNYAELVYHIGSNVAVERHFYLIFEYEAEHEMFRETEQSAILNRLETKAMEIENYLAKVGNGVVKNDNPDRTTAEMLYNYYNRKTLITEPFSSRVDRIIDDMMKVTGIENEGLLPDADIKNLIAPKSIDTTDPDYMIVDGVYKTHLYIDGDSYPTTAYAGWVSSIVSYGDGFDTDIFVQRESAVEVLNKVSSKMKWTRIKLNDREDTHTDYEDIVNNLDGCRFIRAAIKEGKEDPFNICIFTTISANTYQELLLKKEMFMAHVETSSMIAKECKYKEKQAFESVSPFLTLNPNLKKLAKRNMTTSGVACLYPYTAYELSDKGGILYGYNTQNSSLCMINSFDSNIYKNANISIFGATGAGKSFLLQLMALRLRYLGIQTLIIAPDKQAEFRRSCNAVGGTFIDLSPSSDDVINLLDIRPSVSPENDFLDGNLYQETSWMTEKVNELKTFFSLLIPDLTDEEEIRIDNAIIETYHQKGITEENNSIYMDATLKEKGFKEMPIISDLYKVLEKEPDNKRVLVILSQFVKGSAKSFNGHTNVDLNNKYIVFGLEKLNGSKLLAPAMFIALDFIWNKVKENKTERKMIFIDEGWQLIDGTNKKAGEYVERIFKIIRGWGGGAVFATQSMQDLYKSENNYGNSIIACTQTKVILGMEHKDAAFIKDELDLSASEIKEITKYKAGKCLICANSNHIEVQVKASPLEEQLITTKRSDLEAMFKAHVEETEV